jgi:hypothetical protein
MFYCGWMGHVAAEYRRRHAQKKSQAKRASEKVGAFISTCTATPEDDDEWYGDSMTTFVVRLEDDDKWHGDSRAACRARPVEDDDEWHGDSMTTARWD